VRIVSTSVLVLLLGGFANAARAADFNALSEVCEARVFESSEGKKLNYRLLKPIVYDPSQKYPLVLLLHGSGESGDDNTAQMMHGVAEFATDDSRRDFPCFVVTPQCPKKKSWWNSKRKPDEPDPGPTEPMQLVIELLDALPREFSIDTRRLYVTGLSMGGYGVWDLIQRFPEKFAAAAPICGGGDPRQAGRLVRIPIWVFHGGADEGNHPQMSREMVAAIRKAGGKPLYTEYPGVPHNSWSTTYKSPLFMTWLFAQSLEK
jgi:predicted peptidase